MKMWYVYRGKELLGYVHAPSLYFAKKLARTDFGYNTTLKKSKGYAEDDNFE